MDLCFIFPAQFFDSGFTLCPAPLKISPTTYPRPCSTQAVRRFGNIAFTLRTVLYLNNRIYPALGNYRMREITPTMISQFLPSLQEEGLAHGTAEKIYVIIRLIFKMAFLH